MIRLTIKNVLCLVIFLIGLQAMLSISEYSLNKIIIQMHKRGGNILFDLWFVVMIFSGMMFFIATFYHMILVKLFEANEKIFSYKGGVFIFFLLFSFSIPESFGISYEFISKNTPCLPKMDFADYRYFSFTTFTTLGYGDYKPVGICREIAMAEAMLGLTIMPINVALGLSIFSNKS